LLTWALHPGILDPLTLLTVAIKGIKENKNAGVIGVTPRPAMLAGLGGEAAVRRLAASAVLAEVAAGDVIGRGLHSSTLYLNPRCLSNST
jgi:hypothetical protein